ncbi:MAG TPA: hypothetical protein VHH88_04125, partial [Verrucomicrobiae bacterium]|nr:hypothetical protein [Verrucomicrobiae bacterium]
ARLTQPHRPRARRRKRRGAPKQKPAAHRKKPTVQTSASVQPPNGIGGRIELQATDPVFIESAQVDPRASDGAVSLVIKLGNVTGHSGEGTLRVGEREMPVQWKPSGRTVRMEIPGGNQPKLWDEFNPTLRRLTLALRGPGIRDSQTVTFGFREIAAQGRDLVLNGRPIFLRGNTELLPAGFPMLNSGRWKDWMRTCQDYGLNCLHFASWCPPEEAFEAADELGMYLVVEPGGAARSKAAKTRRAEESHQILSAYGNHPSFLLMQASGFSADTEAAAQWVADCHSRDSRHLYSARLSGADSSGEFAIANAFSKTAGTRNRRGFHSAFNSVSDFAAKEKQDAPLVIAHLGQWCSYPDSDTLAAMASARPAIPNPARAAAKDWLADSARLQALFYRRQLEGALAAPGVAGFYLLDLKDFLSREVVPAGILDAAGKAKVTRPESFKAYCAQTVVLADLPRRVWNDNETLEADIRVAHFGPMALARAKPVCVLLNSLNQPVATGELPAVDIMPGTRDKVGHVVIPLRHVTAPGEYHLLVALKDTPWQNEWNLWIYSNAKKPEPVNVLVTHRLDDGVFSLLQLGRRVLWLPKQLPTRHPPARFAPMRWQANNHSFTGDTLGLSCENEHPALGQFPTWDFAEAEWEDVLWRGHALDMTALPRKLQPIVQLIDGWKTNRKLGLLFECRVGKGRLMICGADLERDMAHRPAARQLRSSLLSYLAGADFHPSVSVTREELLALQH